MEPTSDDADQRNERGSDEQLGGEGHGAEELDREVSRRVEHPTAAQADDAPAYSAAQSGDEPGPDTRSGGSGGAAERAAADLDGSSEDEPTRSE